MPVGNRSKDTVWSTRLGEPDGLVPAVSSLLSALGHATTDVPPHIQDLVRDTIGQVDPEVVSRHAYLYREAIGFLVGSELTTGGGPKGIGRMPGNAIQRFGYRFAKKLPPNRALFVPALEELVVTGLVAGYVLTRDNEPSADMVHINIDTAIDRWLPRMLSRGVVDDPVFHFWVDPLKSAGRRPLDDLANQYQFLTGFGGARRRQDYEMTLLFFVSAGLALHWVTNTTFDVVEGRGAS